jgi:hypothetical protein
VVVAAVVAGATAAAIGELLRRSLNVSSLRARAVFAGLAGLVGACASACSSVDSYTTAPGESYCGGLPSPAAFTAGLAPGAQMRVTLDASQLDAQGSPGTVWTYEPPSKGLPSRRLVDGLALQHVPALDSDPLSIPDLGSGRDHTRLFSLGASPPGEPAIVAAVSLRSDGGVEVRLLRPSANAGAAIFGLFTLTKQAGTCGF